MNRITALSRGEAGTTRKRLGVLSVMLLLCVSLAMAAGCGGKAQSSSAASTPDSTEMRTFSKYDFSLQYPKEYLIAQDGLLDEDANSESGVIQVAPETAEFPVLAISWLRSWQWGLEGGLEAGFQGIQNWEGIQSVQKGAIEETTKLGKRMLYQTGHRMLYQYYTATTETQGETVYGIVAAFYCDKSQRQFAFVTMNGGTTTSSEAALADFVGYLTSFVCH